MIRKGNQITDSVLTKFNLRRLNWNANRNAFGLSKHCCRRIEVILLWESYLRKLRRLTKETSWLLPQLILPRDKVMVKQGATVTCYQLLSWSLATHDSSADRAIFPSYTLHPLAERFPTQGSVSRLLFPSWVF